MLNENIQAPRKSKGLSQEELALKLNVVRQTVSKWERGLSVPDAEMLVAIGEVLDTPVSTLPSETVPTSVPGGLQALSEKLEVLNDQFARAQESKRRVLHALCIAIAAATALVLIALASIGGSYLEWDFSNPEYAVAGNDAPWIRVDLRSNGTNHTGGIDRGRSYVPQIRPFIAFAINLPWAPPRNGQHIEQ